MPVLVVAGSMASQGTSMEDKHIQVVARLQVAAKELVVVPQVQVPGQELRPVLHLSS